MLRCLAITLKDDKISEGNETFFVSLTASSPQVSIPKKLAIVDIIDNGRPYVYPLTTSKYRKGDFTFIYTVKVIELWKQQTRLAVSDLDQF